MARFSALLFLAAALPFVLAGSDSCADSEFYYGIKDCCLPYGGTSNTTSPPQGNEQCPTNGWYWHDGKEACVPKKPVDQSPTPQCSGGWEWNESSSTCCEPHTTTTSASPTPSAKGISSHHKRILKSRNNPLCPDNLEACPIAGLGGLTGDYECLDTIAELESCGGCASTGEGQDCAAIEGIWNVGCVRGHCASKSGHVISTEIMGI
ncbi:uncharacterized protein LAESUDRAFT_400004 [Laetiporus sulphureus 93-53]|uniref:Protein CPL1-like domain-containing protein n=1 Tax=Laetiporus sulphureus 93-53 TaxID=1314785 RepID=A0A165CFN3_9APHY|nr:uncharacterized protein LAESUDRAFT_400004 [Laetiporus sulphureus 93-53]KZT02726.1 hypothetical protein LAESUDRAFT_400004 [Laetiporus sulphureus 93-53]